MAMDSYFLAFIADVLAVGAGLGCLYLVIAAIAVERFPKRQPFAASDAPVTILKPLHGAEPDLSLRVASFCMQNYNGPIQVVCGVRDSADAAAREISEIEGPKAKWIELIVNSRDHGSNRKISNLVNMLPSARHETLIVIDSDIEVMPDYLGKIVAHLEGPNVGAVTCLYHGVPKAGAWSQHAALAINSHFLPSVIVALSFGMARPCFGSTIAMRKATLLQMGGFEAFADRLADDYAIGAAVRSAGHEVAVTNFSVGHLCYVENFTALLSQELRVACTIKNIDPLGYVGTLITHPFPLALLSLAFGCEDAGALAVLALTCRGFLCRAVEHAFQLPRQPYRLLPFRDLLSFAIFALSFCSATVTWRGATFRVTSAGNLIPKDLGPAVCTRSLRPYRGRHKVYSGFESRV